jgi:hypothetical protein
MNLLVDGATLVWEEAELPFRKEWTRQQAAVGLVAGLRALDRTTTANPAAALREEARGGPTVDLSISHRIWADAAPWVPGLLTAPLSDADRAWLWSRWQVWMRSVAQERALGREPVDMEIPAPAPGAHVKGAPPTSWPRAAVTLSPIDGDDPFDAQGRVRLTSPLARERIQTTNHSDATTGAVFSWPRAPGPHGEVLALTLVGRPIRRRVQVHVRPRTRIPAAPELGLWLPDTGAQNADDYDGPLTVYLPRQLEPPPGTPMLLELSDLLEYTAFIDRIWKVEVAWSPPEYR